MIANSAQITRHHLANQVAPAYSLARKACACGKVSTARQLAQHGKCTACALAAVRDAIMPGDFAKLQHMLGAVSQYPKSKWGWRNYFAAGSGQQHEAMQRLLVAGLATAGRACGDMTYFYAKRCDAEIAAFKDKSMKAADAANKRWNKGGNTDAMPTHSGGNVDVMPTNNQEPITNNHKPVNTKPSSASPPEPYPEEFETAWQAYPPRPGASKKDSYKGWTARRKEGVPAEALLAGVQRYANYVVLSRTEPQFTKQPATFFGPGEHYKADWAVGATQTQKGVIHGNFGKQDYHKGVGADGTF